MQDEELISKLLQLQDTIKELSIIESTYKNEIDLRTDKQNTDIGKYSLVYKSSNLFDRDKAKQYIFDNDMQNDFMVQDLDYKKVQHFIKATENYNDFVKPSNPSLKIERKK